MDKRKNNVNIIPNELEKIIPMSFYKNLSKTPRIILKKIQYPYFYIDKMSIYMNKDADFSTYYDKIVYVHELGHYLHTDKKIIIDNHIDTDFLNMVYYPFKKDFQNFSIKTLKILKNANKGGMNRITYKKKKKICNYIAYGFDIDELDTKIFIFNDIIEALSLGEYGYGHGKSYYRGINKSTGHEEIFAHAFMMYYYDNEIVEYYFPNGYSGIKKYFNKILI